ncbi:hypothetical protein EJB05_50479, partial [Eragrostis curvula]
MATSICNFPAGDLFDWTATPVKGNSSIESSAPSSGTHHQEVGASTSSVDQDVLNCTGCQILREVLHSNGSETTKLCLHGAAGLFYHATLEVYLANSESVINRISNH